MGMGQISKNRKCIKIIIASSRFNSWQFPNNDFSYMRRLSWLNNYLRWFIQLLAHKIVFLRTVNIECKLSSHFALNNNCERSKSALEIVNLRLTFQTTVETEITQPVVNWLDLCSENSEWQIICMLHETSVFMDSMSASMDAACGNHVCTWNRKFSGRFYIYKFITYNQSQRFT